MRVREAGARLAEILGLVADAARRARQRRDDRALVDAVQIDDRIVAMRAQRADRRGDRLEVTAVAQLLETPQRRAQHVADAGVPAHDFGAGFVHGPVDRHTGERTMEVRDDRQRLDDVAERGHFYDEDAFHFSCGEWPAISPC
jgi:hypothetical protein